MSQFLIVDSIEWEGPLLDEATLAKRRAEQDAKGWEPESRDRVVSQALKAYAALTTSASRGGVRDVSQLR